MDLSVGVIFHHPGGFGSGSFHRPYKKVKSGYGEDIWLTGGLFSRLFIPSFAPSFNVSSFSGFIYGTSFAVLPGLFFAGMIWSIGVLIPVPVLIITHMILRHGFSKELSLIYR
jgi:hypothetical protein